jgi:hypothetical protein
MKILSLYLIAAMAFAGEIRKGPATFDSGQTAVSAASAADRILVETMVPEAKAVHVTISDEKIIGDLLGRLRFSEKHIRGEKVIIDGEEHWIVEACSCDGDYRIHFYVRGSEVVCFGLFHDAFIRVVSVGSKRVPEPEFDLVAGNGAEIRRYLDELVRKTANQASVPTTASVTPAADAPVAPAAIAAHL